MCACFDVRVGKCFDHIFNCRVRCLDDDVEHVVHDMDRSERRCVAKCLKVVFRSRSGSSIDNLHVTLSKRDIHVAFHLSISRQQHCPIEHSEEIWSWLMNAHDQSDAAGGHV